MLDPRVPDFGFGLGQFRVSFVFVRFCRFLGFNFLCILGKAKVLLFCGFGS